MNKSNHIYTLFQNKIFENVASKGYERIRNDQLLGLVYLLFFLELEARNERGMGEGFSISEGFKVEDRVKDFPFFEIVQILSYIKLEISGVEELEINMEENDLYGNDYAHVIDNIRESELSYQTLFNQASQEFLQRKFHHFEHKKHFEEKIFSTLLNVSTIDFSNLNTLGKIEEDALLTPSNINGQEIELTCMDSLVSSVLFMIEFLQKEKTSKLKSKAIDIYKIEEENQYDGVISIYPPEIKEYNEISISLANHRTKYRIDSSNTSWYLTDVVLRLLKEKGKAIVGVHSSLLEEEQLYAFRADFLNHLKTLEVYSIGDDLMEDYGVNTLLVFEKGPTLEQLIFASFDGQGKMKSICFEDGQKVMENNTILSPKRYLLDVQEDEEYFYLYQLLNTANVMERGFYGKYIKPSSTILNESFLNYEIASEELEDVTYRQEDKVIHDSLFICQLNRLKNNQLQYRWLQEQENTGVIYDDQLNYFVIDETKIHIPYLINELHSPFFLEQLEAYSNGSFLKSISVADFLNIKIPKISFHDQKLKVVGFREAYVHSKAKEIGLEKANLALKEDFYNEYRSLRHNLGHLLSSIQSSIEVIGNVLEHGDYDLDLSTVINRKRNVTFGDQITKVKKSSSDIYNWLKSFEDQLRQDYTLEKMPMEQVISLLEKRYGNRKEFNLELNLHHHNVDIFPFLHQEGFFKVTDNIIQNAISHGFVDGQKAYKIKVDFKLTKMEEENLICIEIMNNGLPFPEDFDFNALVERGQTSNRNNNTGLGGNDIYRTMKAMNGEFDLYLDRNIEFPISYKLYFSCDVRNKSTVSR